MSEPQNDFRFKLHFEVVKTKDAAAEDNDDVDVDLGAS